MKNIKLQKWQTVLEKDMLLERSLDIHERGENDGKDLIRRILQPDLTPGAAFNILATNFYGLAVIASITN